MGLLKLSSVPYMVHSNVSYSHTCSKMLSGILTGLKKLMIILSNLHQNWTKKIMWSKTIDNYIIIWWPNNTLNHHLHCIRLIELLNDSEIKIPNLPVVEWVACFLQLEIQMVGGSWDKWATSWFSRFLSKHKR